MGVRDVLALPLPDAQLRPDEPAGARHIRGTQLLDYKAVQPSLGGDAQGDQGAVDAPDQHAATPDAAPARQSTVVDITSRLPAQDHEMRLLARRPAQPPGRLGLMAKRTIDIAGASAGLVVLGPMLLATAALISAVDGRPVMFRQPRAGLRQKPFRIYKFRTMRVGADAQRAALRAHNEVTGGASFKLTNDPRVTPLGRLLRRTSIDELPQLLNVLRGDMSLVGPRPHPFDDLAGYERWHHARFAVKPGITGLWQVSSRREPDFDRWVELDLEYIRHWSPMLDIKIMVRTIPAVLRGEGR